MLTTRGWWFLVLVLSLLALGVLDDRRTLTLLALTLFLWFVAEWFLFVLRVRLAVPTLRVRREVQDDRGEVENLWAGHIFQIKAELTLSHWLTLPYMVVTDLVPFGADLTRGTTEREGALTADEPMVLHYSIICPAAGRVRFEGLGVQLADFQGFFYHATFIPEPVICRVLPPLADAEGNRPTVKRHNLLPSPGQHRHLRPGSGSELLDLRDYLPGDPPKTIAWKVSARRDRLITKEFESEVPIRCTLFVDTSQSVRVGLPGQNALTRLVDIAAAVVQAAAGVRDLSGLCLFDEKAVSAYVRPARGPRHIIHLLHVLADAAELAPATGKARLDGLLPLAAAFAQEVYPYLLRPDLNRVPMWLGWFRSLAASPQRKPAGRRIVRWLFLAGACLPFAVLGFLIYLFGDVAAPIIPVFVPLPGFLLAIIGAALALIAAAVYYHVGDRTYTFLALSFASRGRRLVRWRKRLAALLSVHYGLAPGGLSRLLEDDEQCALYLQRFLGEHHVPYPLSFYDERGRYLFASPGKIEVLARALLRAIGKGHDNELFVLLVDVLELVDQLDPLLRAVRVALARHHQVLLICPWPPGIALPDASRPGKNDVPALETDVQAALRQVTVARLHQAYRDVRHTFARLQVPVVCAASGDPVRLILNRLDRLRLMGLGRRR
jgi:uncharacterized protein (DUF58 family)